MKFMRGNGSLQSVRSTLSANVDQFSARFTPVNLRFAMPNWNTIMTKRDKPAMSEGEFEGAIKQLAREDFQNGKTNSARYQKLLGQYCEAASLGRKAIFEDSMQKTGGKTNAATAFFDHSGNVVMHYLPQSYSYHEVSTEAELGRAHSFADIYNAEFDKMKNGR